MNETKSNLFLKPDGQNDWSVVSVLNKSLKTKTDKNTTASQFIASQVSWHSCSQHHDYKINN